MSADIMVDRPRCLDWTPLATHNCLRLRNLIQIIGFNIQCQYDDTTHLYYTLHSSPMSSPFFKSVAVEKKPNGSCIWPEIKLDSKMTKSPASCVCIRVWERRNCREFEEHGDQILFFWGVYFSGLVPVIKRNEARYLKNSLVFHMPGGLFASADSFEPDCIAKISFPFGLPNFNGSLSSTTSSVAKKSDSFSFLHNGKTSNCDELKLINKVKQLSSTPNKMLAIKSSPDLASFLWNGSPSKFSPRNENASFSSFDSMNQNEFKECEPLLKYRYLQMTFNDSECRRSYSVNKLLLLQEKQRRIKNQMEACLDLRDKICTKSVFCLNLEMMANRAALIHRQKVQPGMGRQLSRLLYQEEEPPKPEDILKGQDLRRQIEIAKFRCKGLKDERDRMKVEVRHLNERLTQFSNENILLESSTMARYRGMCKEKEQLSNQRMVFAERRDSYEKLKNRLCDRRRTLVRRILQIYQITKVCKVICTFNTILSFSLFYLTNKFFLDFSNLYKCSQKLVYQLYFNFFSDLKYYAKILKNWKEFFYPIFLQPFAYLFSNFFSLYIFILAT